MRLANSYAPDLHTGRKLAVRWSGAVLDKDNAKAMDEYKWSGEWFDAVYKRMASDFGPAIAETWAIGKGYTTLGESARVEHEARVIGLARLMDDMRSGRLTKVKP